MKEKIYLRPMGLVTAGDSDALPLAGGPFAFATAEIVERGNGKVKRHIAPAGRVADLIDRALLDRLTSPRAPMLGLTFDRLRLIGILNVTPDSFSDGGRFLVPEKAIAHGRAMFSHGADIVDVGGESTRPGAEPVDTEEEIERVVPVVAALAKGTGGIVSVDSRKSSVMAAALDAGARMINDVSALTFDPESLALAALRGAPVVLMHARGDPKTMQDDPRYDDVLLDVYDTLEERVAACERAGIERRSIVVDPGLGFGKTFEHNLALMRGMSLFHGLGCPLLVGASRKSFIGRLSGGVPPSERLAGSLAAAIVAAAQGAQLVRVHDVAETRRALDAFAAFASCLQSP